MFRYVILLLIIPVGLVGWAAAQQPLQVYYESGDTMEQITDHGVTVTVTMRDTGKENWVWAYIANHSNDAANIVPANIALHQNSPKDEELRMKSERELRKAGGHRVFWGQVIAGVGAGLSRKISTAKTTDSYGNSFTTTVNTPDYEAQARWLAWADQRTQKEQAITDFNQHEWLRANTLFPGSEYAGRLIFVRDKALASGFVRISIDSRNYQFPFPPPPSARPPQSAPALPSIGSVTSSTMNNGGAPEEPASSMLAPRAGVLGVSGANWEEGGVRGVEILGIAQDSAAEMAGLHTGDVITDVNGRKIRSTQDLAVMLAQSGPASKMVVGYFIKINLGWMLKEAAVILAKGNWGFL